MKQKQKQSVVVNINQPAKPRRRKRAKKSAKKKPQLQAPAPAYIPMPQSVIRYYDNTIPPRNVEIKPAPVAKADIPKILQGVSAETEYVAPEVVARKPIAVSTPEPETENVLLREEAPVEIGGEEAPSARDVVEDERLFTPIEPPEPDLVINLDSSFPQPPTAPPVLAPEQSALALLEQPAPVPSSALALLDERRGERERPPERDTSRARNERRREALQAVAIRQPTEEEWGGGASEIIPVFIEPRKQTLAPLFAEARPATSTEFGAGGFGIEPAGQDVAEMFRRGARAQIRPPTEPPPDSPQTASGLAEATIPQLARQQADEARAEEENELEKARKVVVRPREPEWYKKVKKDFAPFNADQKRLDIESGYSPAEATRRETERRRAFRDEGRLFGFDQEPPASLKRGFAPVGEGALGGGGGFSFVDR
jgi:hypothetical protein